MEKIASFTIDHIRMNRWLYVSRKDYLQWGDTITTFDIRMVKPNAEPVMNIAEMHAIEHLGATFLRNHKEWGSKIIYFGPMGCRTGFYILLNGNLESREIISLIIEMYEFISTFEWDIPGQSAMDCGNYLDMNLPMARYIAKKYLNEVLLCITDENLVYPQ
jgi:S-ribosylhomocysteine lyase